MSKQMTEKEFNRLMKIRIEELDLTVRVFNGLMRENIECVEDIVKLSTKDMMELKNFRDLDVEKLIKEIRSLGLEVCPIDKEPSEWVEELREKMVQNDIKNHGENFNDLMKTAVEKLDLSVRSWAYLDRAGKKTIEDLIKMTNEELCQVRNINKSCVKEIISAIRAIGLDIRPDKFGEEEWIEYLKAEFKEQTETQEPKTTNKTNRKGLIAKLLEVWNEDVEKEVQDIIDRNI